MKHWIVIVAALVLAGCAPRTETATEADEKLPPIVVPGGTASLVLEQRTTTPLPGSNDRVSVTVDDITNEQVMTTILEGSTPIAGPMSLREGDAMPFSVDGHGYTLTLSSLDVPLVGKDQATFILAAAEGAGTAMTEAQKIERLIAIVSEMDDARFIRNGEEHTATDAAAHLESKWRAAGDEVRTAEEFIEKIASRSSLSGEPYVIEFPDGREVPAEQFLREQLAQLEGGTRNE